MYCKSQGIKLNYTVPKTPELNCLTERIDETIMERARSILSHAKLPKSHWVHAILMIVYLINKYPSMPLKGDVPERVWTGRNVFYHHLRMLGCLAHMHVAKDLNSKLDNKSKPCMFLGYLEDEFGYMLWNLLDKKVVRSRDIVFMEDKTIEDCKQIKTVSSSQSAAVMESTLANPSTTQLTDKQQLTDEIKYEPTSTQ